MRLVEGEAETKIGHSIVTRAFRNIGYPKMCEIVSKSSNLDQRLADANFQKIINGIRDQKRIAYDWLCGQSLPDKDKEILESQQIYLQVGMPCLYFITFSNS